MSTSPIQRLTSQHGHPIAGTRRCGDCGRSGLLIVLRELGHPLLVHPDTDELHSLRCPGVPQPAPAAISDEEAFHHAHKWKEYLHGQSRKETDPARREALLREFMEAVAWIAKLPPGDAECPICHVTVRDKAR